MKSYTLVGIASLTALLILYVAYMSIKQDQTAGADITDTPESVHIFAPSNFGVPETINGRPVLAVFTAENKACQPENHMEIVLGATEPSHENFIRSNTVTEYQPTGNYKDWDISITTTSVHQARVITTAVQYNAIFRTHGCMRMGGVTVTLPAP